MYKSFFGLRENPFNSNPDPHFLHRTPRIQEALDQLIYGVQNRKGLLLLTGEAGTGKTTLINYLLDWLRQRHTPTAFIFNSHLKVNHLFDFILTDFGVSSDSHLAGNMLLELSQWLVARFREGSHPVLIVDEAQGLSFELLEEIRLLLNLETASEKLLQIVLAGQPELEEKLKSPAMRQLRQRIALRCNTSPLTLEEARGYIADRLRIAGATREPVFESGTVEALHYYSRGIPRVMNLLCENSLINAYTAGRNPVPPQMVEEAAHDFLMEEFRPLSSHPGLTSHIDNKLTVMRSEFTGEDWRSSREEAGGSLEEIRAQSSATLVEFAEEERELSSEAIMIVATPKNQEEKQEEAEEEDAVLEENLDESQSILNFVPASPGFQQVNRRSTLKPGTAQSDCAAELVATMERLLAAASSPSGFQPNSESTKRSSRSLMSSLPGQRIKPAASRTVSPGVSARVRRTTRETIGAIGVVFRQWKLEFRHDWNLTASALNLSRVKKSVGHWLQQPLSPKPMTSTKDQTV